MKSTFKDSVSSKFSMIDWGWLEIIVLASILLVLRASEESQHLSHSPQRPYAIKVDEPHTDTHLIRPNARALSRRTSLTPHINVFHTRRKPRKKNSLCKPSLWRDGETSLPELWAIRELPFIYTSRWNHTQRYQNLAQKEPTTGHSTQSCNVCIAYPSISLSHLKRLWRREIASRGEEKSNNPNEFSPFCEWIVIFNICEVKHLSIFVKWNTLLFEKIQSLGSKKLITVQTQGTKLWEDLVSTFFVDYSQLSELALRSLYVGAVSKVWILFWFIKVCVRSLSNSITTQHPPSLKVTQKHSPVVEEGCVLRVGSWC